MICGSQQNSPAAGISPDKRTGMQRLSVGPRGEAPIASGDVELSAAHGGGKTIACVVRPAVHCRVAGAVREVMRVTADRRVIAVVGVAEAAGDGGRSAAGEVPNRGAIIAAAADHRPW